jgi:uncharacterized protein (DUF1330 family)
MSEAPVSKPAYFMVQVTTNSLEQLATRYAHAAIASLASFGGEMIAGTPAPMVLEGAWEGSWVALLRFPNLSAAQRWYDSSDYQPLKKLRISELTQSGQILLVEGL